MYFNIQHVVQKRNHQNMLRWSTNEIEGNPTECVLIQAYRKVDLKKDLIHKRHFGGKFF